MLGCTDCGDEFFEGGHGLDGYGVRSVGEEGYLLAEDLGELLLPLFPQRINELGRGADVGDNVAAFPGGFPRDAKSGRVELADPIAEAVPVETPPRPLERVCENRLRPGADIVGVDLLDNLRVRYVPLFVALPRRDTVGVQLRAHGPVEKEYTFFDSFEERLLHF